MGICLFYYERRSTACPRLERSDINLHYKIFLCAFSFFFAASLFARSLPPASSLMYVEISRFVNIYSARRKKIRKSICCFHRDGFFSTFSSASLPWEIERRKTCWNCDKFPSTRAMPSCTISRIITNRKCFSHGRENMSARNKANLKRICLLF